MNPSNLYQTADDLARMLRCRQCGMWYPKRCYGDIDVCWECKRIFWRAIVLSTQRWGRLRYRLAWRFRLAYLRLLRTPADDVHVEPGS